MRLFLPILFAPAAASAMQVQVERTELCAFAQRIVVGEVTGVEPRFTTDDRIERAVHLTVSHTVKGPVTEDIELRAEGGTIGELTHWVEHSPVFLENATYLILVGADGTVVAGEQGLVRVTPARSFKGETLQAALESVEACRAD